MNYEVNKYKNINDSFVLSDDLVLDEDGNIPLIYWPVTPNFGDLLSPWLFAKITDKKVKLVDTKVMSQRDYNFRSKFKLTKDEKKPNYISIGSIISRCRDKSIVWGSGSFGVEPENVFNKNSEYLSVRGPLTRHLLKKQKISCPEVYGDPALLVPLFFNPVVEKKYEIGLVLRWSESEWLKSKTYPGVKIIDLGESDVENTLEQILSCKSILTSSLHGLIIADTYNIPSAWLASESPKGGEFKYYDYFLSVDKIRKPIHFDIQSENLSIDNIKSKIKFDDREITFNYYDLLKACPLLKEIKRI